MLIETILNDVKNQIESIDEIDPEYLVSKGTYNGFEKLVPIVLEEVIETYRDEYDIKCEVKYGHHFPDLDIIIDNNKFGVEIKFRKNGTWKTNGNSVFESITDDNYENIYLLFGSQVPQESKIRVKYSPYWQATSAIKVTHSPRFVIDMADLSNSVFETEADYNTLRQMGEKDKVEFVQNYLSKNTEGAKWYVSDSSEIKATPIENLPKETQNQIIAEILILYPDDLLIGPSQTKYKNAAQYMLDDYFAFSKALRDYFSSSGQVKINGIKFPRIIQKFIDNRLLITSTLQEASDDFKNDAINGWLDRELITEREVNILSSYKKVLDNVASKDENLSNKINEIGFDKFSSFIF